MQQDPTKELLQEMQWVRKLLMLQTLAAGYKQKDLASAMGVSAPTLSRMMPKGLSKTPTNRRVGASPEAED